MITHHEATLKVFATADRFSAIANIDSRIYLQFSISRRNNINFSTIKIVDKLNNINVKETFKTIKESIIYLCRSLSIKGNMLFK